MKNVFKKNTKGSNYGVRYYFPSKTQKKTPQNPLCPAKLWILDTANLQHSNVQLPTSRKNLDPKTLTVAIFYIKWLTYLTNRHIQLTGSV